MSLTHSRRRLKWFKATAIEADETEGQADLLFKECSLSTYYDEVALKGLQLAANDAYRGALGHDQLSRILSTVTAPVVGLDQHDDTQPPGSKSDDGVAARPDIERDLPNNPDLESVLEGEMPASWRSPTKVSCIAGRGPLDKAASFMLAQPHGMGGHLVAYSEFSREGISILDVSGAATACISYLNIGGSPAHLRYLMQRLRQKLTRDVPILVGLWPAADTLLSDKQIKVSIRADYFTSSLGRSVKACAEVAHKVEQSETMAA